GRGLPGAAKSSSKNSPGWYAFQSIGIVSRNDTRNEAPNRLDQMAQREGGWAPSWCPGSRTPRPARSASVGGFGSPLARGCRRGIVENGSLSEDSVVLADVRVRKIVIVAKRTTVDDILPLVADLSPQERVRLLKLIAARPATDAATGYAAIPPGEDEFSSDDEPLSWEAD